MNSIDRADDTDLPSFDTVSLEPNYPGAQDPFYLKRRSEIVSLAIGAGPGRPPPRIEYTAAENAMWPLILDALAPLHAEHTCELYKACVAGLPLPADRIPQFVEVNELLAPRTGFELQPAAGLLNGRSFLTMLGDGVFMGTQYVRHPSTPFFSAEPDVVHEIFGHAVTLSHPTFAALARAFGAAAAGADDAAIERLARLYWFTIETGLVYEAGRLRTYGAAFVSSVAELTTFEQQEIRPFDIEQITHTNVVPTELQGILYVAPSFGSMIEQVMRYLRGQYDPAV